MDVSTCMTNFQDQLLVLIYSKTKSSKKEQYLAMPAYVLRCIPDYNDALNDAIAETAFGSRLSIQDPIPRDLETMLQVFEFSSTAASLPSLPKTTTPPL
nr:hypothetical protein CFP56_57846 [Quercus suber]